MLVTLASLDAFRRHLGLDATSTDERLLPLLRVATAHLERTAGRSYMPYLSTYRHSLMLHDLGEIILRDDLLELIALVDGTGDTIPISAALVLYGSILRLIDGAFAYDDTPYEAITVTGIWGWHDDWSNAWVSSSDALTGALTTSATTLSVANSAGMDAQGDTPRFSAGQLLRIESEYLAVLAVAGNTLTVMRGAQGTTAVSHSTATPISIFVPPLDVVQACLRVATALYREPDAQPSLIADPLPSLHRLRL